MIRPFVSLVVVVLAACGADPTLDVRDSARATSAARPGDVDSAWLPALPGDLVDVVADDTVRVRRCLYTVGTAERPAEFGPPTYVAFVQRECAPGGAVLLGESTTRPVVVADSQSGRDAIVVAFTQKISLSGAGFIHEEIVHVDAASGAIVHDAHLGALPPFGTGTVEATDVSVRGNGTVIVTGTKNGVMPGEIGAGTSFTATYEGFLDDADFSPAPTQVLAY
jgi:hypothetical protein